MPRVAINGCRRRRTIKSALISPTSPPARMPTSTAIGVGNPQAVSASAATSPAQAIIEPTERSMPPVIITSVIPSALIAISE